MVATHVTLQSTAGIAQKDLSFSYPLLMLNKITIAIKLAFLECLQTMSRRHVTTVPSDVTHAKTPLFASLATHLLLIT